MDVIDRLHAGVNASGMRKKTIAEKAGLPDASTLSRILHKRMNARHHQLEAIAGAIGRTLQSFYPEERLPVGVRNAHEALRILTDFVKQHETTAVSTTQVPRIAAKPKRASSSDTKPRASAKSPRSRVVRPFHAAANPNAILLNSDDDDD